MSRSVCPLRWAGQTEVVTDSVIEEVPAAGDDSGTPAHPAVTGAGAVGLAVGALGVVFGDIGTSPLYALQTVFSIDHGAVRPASGDVYGVISLAVSYTHLRAHET